MSEVTLRTCANAVQTSVASTAGSKAILAANAARRGAIIQNTSTDVLYLLFGGGTADTTVTHTVRLASNAYYEVPFGFTGAITGISSGTNGAANITEFT